jgi:hypothetical protein
MDMGIEEYRDLLLIEEIKNKQLQAENKRLKKTIEDYGNNLAGFDWAILERIDNLERTLEEIITKSDDIARYILKDK